MIEDECRVSLKKILRIASKCQKSVGVHELNCCSGGSRGEARGTRPPPYFSTKMRSEGPKQIFLETGPPLSQALDDRPPPPPYLKVWIRNCIVYRNLTTRTVWQQLCKCLNVEFLLTFNELLKRYNIVPSSQFAAEQMSAINSGPEGGNG